MSTLNSYEISTLERMVETHGKRTVLNAVYASGKDYKSCPGCEALLHESKFYIRKNGYLSGYCIECSKKNNNKKRKRKN